MLLPNKVSVLCFVHSNGFQNILCYYQTIAFRMCTATYSYFKTSYVTTKWLFFLGIRSSGNDFKTSYVTTKPTVLSHSSILQFPENRSTAGFSSKFTSRHQIFVTIPKNDNFPCKIRLFRTFIKFSVGKISVSILSNFQNTVFSQMYTLNKISSLFPIRYI